MAAPRSKEFDDVYFSEADGLAETKHVFLDGNELPASWEKRENFVIAETGFGTGLNFLAVWKLFEETAGADQRLHFISVEKYPLGAGDIDAALSHWAELDAYRKQLVAAYPDEACGLFTHDFGRVTLSIYFDDVISGFRQCAQDVDAWFLDGFRPSSNPEMWSDGVFEQVARLSHTGTRFATFTSAGFVRRGLTAAGFEVKKIPGYGRKREMSVGVFK